jgi:type III pantothenate kinase
MQLIVDIGNSNIVIAVFDGDWKNIFRYETKENQPQIYYEKGLGNILFEWGLKPSMIDKAIISSVVPDMNERIVNSISNLIGKEAILINASILQQLNIHIPHVNEIGSDLVANSVAALSIFKQPCIVVDFGTALTFTVVHPKAGIQGVTICPGIKTAFASLASNTAQLPNVSLQRPESAIGKNTVHALQAGVIIGYEGLVSHLIERIKSELDEPYLVIGTGGLSTSLTNITKNFDHVNKLLTIEGIKLIGDQIA